MTRLRVLPVTSVPVYTGSPTIFCTCVPVQRRLFGSGRLPYPYSPSLRYATPGVSMPSASSAAATSFGSASSAASSNSLRTPGAKRSSRASFMRSVGSTM